MSPFVSLTALRTVAGYVAPVGLMSMVVSAKLMHSVISAVDLSSKGRFEELVLRMITWAGLNSLISLFDGGGAGRIPL